MNYRHIYHAGNFTDVVKHSILVILLEALRAKGKEFIYLDTHAGIGLYDLSSSEALRSPEYASGILKLLNQNNIPKQLEPYINIVKKYLCMPKLKEDQAYYGTYGNFYPGSPMLALEYQDVLSKIILNELHAEDFLTMKQVFNQHAKVNCHKRHAYELLNALLPLKPRALTIIDPSYEKIDEFSALIYALHQACEKFPSGIYLIWYPIVAGKTGYREFVRKCTHLAADEILLAELIIHAETDSVGDIKGLIGCGMVIINPPWQIADAIKTAIQYLWQLFRGPTRGSSRVIQLKNK